MSRVALDIVGNLATITLDGPKLSALDADFLAELRQKMKDARDAQGILLTGTGRAFSAGVDLDQVLNGGFDYAKHLLRELNDSVLDLFTHPTPVVAAINGHAIAGGCVIILAADLRVATQGKIGLNELGIGVPFPPAPLAAAQFVLGTRASKLIYDAALHETEDALASGFIDEISAPTELLAHARAKLEYLASIPTQTFALTKQALRTSARESMAMSEDQVDQLAREWTTPEILERIAKVLNR